MLRKIPSHFWIVTALILIAALMRLLTNYFSIWNFTPITAMALFSGAAMKDKRLAFLIPLAAMLITDAIIGFYSGVFVVYFALLLITLFGLILRNRIKVMPVILGSLGASVIFYLVTNFALFYPTWLYPHSITGIMSSYTAAIPFFRTAVAGDLIYSVLLFSSYVLISRRLTAAETAS
ncbi:MAG: hypothetical protein JST18_03045 [Bacteroidetes bacterium]|nr:hypothetical protein [Bacteroidota bacterium]